MWWLIRGSDGQWCDDFTKFIGRCGAYMAEIWGAFVGLKLTYSKGYKIELLLEAKVVAENILDPNTV